MKIALNLLKRQHYFRAAGAVAKAGRIQEVGMFMI
jgi:hypothetical protein